MDATLTNVVESSMMDKNKVQNEFQEALEKLKTISPELMDKRDSDTVSVSDKRPYKLQKVLVANRGEIAKRFFLALHEEGIPSVAIVTDVDKGQSWYEFADEVVFIGDETNYTNIATVIAAASLIKANAIYAGYGFLSENADFVESIEIISNYTGEEIIFMGPNYKTMRLMGDKVRSRELAKKHEVPLFESSNAFTTPDVEAVKAEANRIGYPVIVKLSAGGGGKGMYPVFSDEELPDAVESCVRIGKDLYNDSTFYIERFIQRPVHIEVQVFNGRAVGIRKCAVQRRNQKIIEESGHTFLEDHLALSFLSSAERLAIVSGYSTCGAGTVEFLIDDANGKFGFMEMNTRLQVEYGVTDQSLGIDLAKWHILYFDGREKEIEGVDTIKFRVAERQHAIECRIYAEEPESDYRPSPGTIQQLDFPTFNGIRSDFGFVKGDKILSMYDPMIGKLIGYGASREEALIRLERALQELYVKGVRTNINQLIKIVRHPEFINPNYTNNLLPENPDLSFTEDDSVEKEEPNRRSNKQVIFGAFTEYIKHLHQVVKDYMVIASVDGVIDSDADSKIPFKFKVNYKNKENIVEFIQVKIDTFYTYVNGVYNGKIKMTSFNDRSDDFLVIFGNASKRIRVDRQVDCIVLRMRDDSNKINYYRMNVLPEGIEEADTVGVVSSPFQGSFVSFSRDDLAVGDKVKAGEPLMILSAMKMETVIEAPIDGTIEYILEDGELSRLQIAKTLDGRIIGKSLQEGEMLVKIASDKKEDDKESEKQSTNVQSHFDSSTNTFDLIYRENSEDMISENADKHFEVIIELFQAMISGFLLQPTIIERLKNIMAKIPAESWQKMLDEKRSDEVCKLILNYINIKRLFSPVVSHEGFSYPEELNHFVRNWQNKDVELSSAFKNLLDELLECYGVENWENDNEVKNIQIQQLFLLFKLSYDATINHWPKVGKQQHVVSNLKTTSKLTVTTLKKLYAHTQTQIDESSSRFLHKIISDHFPDTSVDIYPGQNLVDKEDSVEVDKFKKALSKPESKLVPKKLDKWMSKSLEEKISILENNYTIERLESSPKNIVVYKLQSKADNNDKKYLTYSFVDFAKDSGANEVAQEAMINAAAVISGFQSVEKLSSSRLEVVFQGKEVVWDTTCNEKQYINYHELKRICASIITNFYNNTITSGVIDSEVVYPHTKTVQRKMVKFYQKDESIAFDIFHKNNKANPYYAEQEENIADQKLFANYKWPLEMWAAECFDPGSMEEVKIDFIDNNEKGVPVGSKIFIGTINGKEACFYMKDFRIIGGATGDLEGLKYGAACYLAYLKGYPLYMWNDSAGANIKQGVVSLNRGGQGFMMNSLLRQNVSPEKFKRYTENVSDPSLKQVFQELNEKFNLSTDKPAANGRPMIIAVGTGASAGLDVYGSSQATIQLILDSDNSYRVLTGSNVIKSVMGEDISNYDIGGAKILGKWTGIVDFVADDKIDLIRKVYELQGLFSSEETHNEIKRPETVLVEKTDSYKSIVFDESVIKNNVDNGLFSSFKSEYYGSNALLGGFAKIAGRRVVIMGPRTNSGLRSTSSIIKAREILKVAQRTATSQILVFGEKWMQPADNRSTSSMRPRLDLMNTLNDKVGKRVHIITHVEGLKLAELNSTADVLIFVKPENISENDLEFVERNTTFIVDSFKEAYDLSQKVITMLEVTYDKDLAIESKDLPKVPTDSSEPYDMIEAVINPAFDKDSFIEFYSAMNTPSGPNFITGLATLNGFTVGVIADQPKIQGGGADAFGTNRFRVFTNLMNRNNIPIVMLSNSSGFVPGSQQERYRIQAIGAESLDANILGEVPVVSLVLNQNYGGRQIQAFSKFLRPGIVYMALEDATMAVMGVNAAFDLLGARKYNKIMQEESKEKAEEFRIDFVEKYLEKAKAKNDATETGVLDWTVKNAKEIRNNLIKGLSEAFKRCRDIFDANWPEI